MTEFKRLDKVKIGRHVLIVTGVNHNRPKNKYTGVLENGQGRELIFGERHNPVKVGVAADLHPALMLSKARKRMRGVMDEETKAGFRKLLNLVEQGKFRSAKKLVAELRQLGW